MNVSSLKALADMLVLGALLERLRERHGEFELLAHWKQGEFHHDVVLQLLTPSAQLDGDVIVVSTNCNGGIKEVLLFDEVPERYALWHSRCPDNQDFEGTLPPIRAHARTHHWFEPCELLRPDARSELRPEHRRRQLGGGWEPRG
ncbi:MAG: hypothetical protein ACI9KE_002068 [Polyangiales bacterium]|jgi:hypothetical protein